ncbi:MAG: protoporphyrinogen IX oxidase [Crocinitomicaceae bacterium]|nr:protoporphyrinogen IX oxidase [Crocinitomicaceae bacterium]|tara:strand:- start:23115 stop:23651 length:537 start_codon:yes stop_codon:yes gene_type:complete
MTFEYLKALHLVFMVTWFAGLFYIVRLFIYHTEANLKPESEKQILIDQFKIMEKRLWYGITWPSAILISIFAFWMLYERPAYLTEPFMQLKLAFIAGLYLYHMSCQRIYSQLQNNIYKYSSLKLRLWNELATLFLVSIIFIIVLRDTISFVWGLAGIFGLGLALWAAIRMYKSKRSNQ